MSGISETSVFENKILENGINYYVFPEKYPLFKANNVLNKGTTITLKPNKPYFFGLKKTDPNYIESYEDEYGVIFEFETMRPYKLIALDDHVSQTTLYNKAPNNIKEILVNNYGFNNGLRKSESEPDREISAYICSQGYDGYAIYDMKTDNIGGKFHAELMVCDASGIRFVKQVTPDKRVQGIIESGKLKKLSKEMKTTRKKKYSPSSLYGSPPKTLRLVDDENIFNFPMHLDNASTYNSPINVQNRNPNIMLHEDEDEDQEYNIKPRFKLNFNELGGKKSMKETRRKKSIKGIKGRKLTKLTKRTKLSRKHKK